MTTKQDRAQVIVLLACLYTLIMVMAWNTSTLELRAMPRTTIVAR